MSDSYAPFTNPVALEASPFQLPSGDILHGSDPAPKPFVPGPTDYSAWNFPYQIGNTIEGIAAGLIGKSQAHEAADKAATDRSPSAPDTRNLIEKYPVLTSVVLVVFGLILLSRGLGVLVESQAENVLSLANPEKFPGIGHAIQGLKRGKK